MLLYYAYVSTQPVHSVHATVFVHMFADRCERKLHGITELLFVMLAVVAAQMTALTSSVLIAAASFLRHQQ